MASHSVTDVMHSIYSTVFKISFESLDHSLVTFTISLVPLWVFSASCDVIS